MASALGRTGPWALGVAIWVGAVACVGGGGLPIEEAVHCSNRLCPTGQGPRKGQFELASSTARLLSVQAAERTESVLQKQSRLRFQLFVPEGYVSSRPAGLLVYISADPSGRVPSSWKRVLRERNLIWVGPRDAGNRQPPARRVALALLALRVAHLRYRLDPERIYIGGFSGGGKIAGIVSARHPQLFKGTFFSCGAPVWRAASRDKLAASRSNRHDFVSGTQDLALELTKRAYRSYRRAGLRDSKLIVVGGMGHENPGAGKFARVLRYLDARPRRTPAGPRPQRP